MKITEKYGFTLIELMVVVAVIGILSAIAVPNMLEAQARSKVSRARADMKALANAIESYATDNGRPPFDGEPGFTYWGWVNSLSQVTTPVAYITSLPVDPFQYPGLQNPTRPGHTHFLSNGKHTFDYSTSYWNDIPNDVAMTEIWRAHFGYSTWKITSAGPDNTHTFGLTVLYDPTNGTLSFGDLILSQSGSDAFQEDEEE